MGWSHVVQGIVALACGWIMWTLTEYVVHRFVFHGGRSSALRRMAAWEHTRHHRVPLHTKLALRLSGHAAIAASGVPVGVAIWAMTNVWFGVGSWLGWAGGYVVYEVGHWRLHHRPPRSARGILARRRHLAHHAADAAANFGVTVPWWDHVFGTEKTPSSVTVPAAHAAAWLTDDGAGYEGLSVRTR